MSTPLTRDALIQRFHSYGRPKDGWLIGGEFERLLLHGDGRPVGYAEPKGIAWVLGQLQERFGWSPVFEGEHLIALTKDGASTTLEPGGQVELSGAPHASLHDLAQEAWSSIGELRTITEGEDLHLVALGLTPYARIADIPWVPKGRYRVMREYLGEVGPLAHVMMKGTSSFQANYDFSDEADCAAKVSAMSRLGPLTTAIFANSPVSEGADSGHASWRAHAWTLTDPARTGFPVALREGYTHEGWVDVLLDVPMMFYKRDGRWEHARGASFRQFMTQGLDGHFPSWSDWELHQTSVFPEVRVKSTIEIRGADACPLPIALGGIAMWTGLMYDAVALDEATQLAKELAALGEPMQHQACAAKGGLRCKLGGRPAVEWARALIDIAGRGLSRSRPAERALLEPVEAMIAHGESPAVAVLRIFQECDQADVFLKRVLSNPGGIAGHRSRHQIASVCRCPTPTKSRPPSLA